MTNGGGCRADYLKWQGYDFLQTKTAERYKSFRRLALNHVFDGILCR